MILNKGTSPITEGIYRAALTTGATFISVTFVAYQTIFTLVMPDGERWKESAIAGVIAAVAPFVSQTLMAGSDQSRAHKDETKPADVPVAAEGITVRKV